MALPEPTELSLLQSADYISGRTGESEKKARTALYAALQAGTLCSHATTKSVRHLDSHEKANAEESGDDPNEIHTFFGVDFIPEEYWRNVGFEKVFLEAETGVLNAMDDDLFVYVGWQFISHDSGYIAGYYLNPTIRKNEIDEWLSAFGNSARCSAEVVPEKTKKSTKPRYQANRVKDWALKQNNIPHSASKAILAEIATALGSTISAKTARQGFVMAQKIRDEVT